MNNYVDLMSLNGTVSMMFLEGTKITSMKKIMVAIIIIGLNMPNEQVILWQAWWKDLGLTGVQA